MAFPSLPRMQGTMFYLEALGTGSVPCLRAPPPGLHLVGPSNTASKLASGPTSSHMLPACLLRALPQEAHCLSGSLLSPSKWESLSIPVCFIHSMFASFTE